MNLTVNGASTERIFFVIFPPPGFENTRKPFVNSVWGKVEGNCLCIIEFLSCFRQFPIHNLPIIFSRWCVNRTHIHMYAAQNKYIRDLTSTWSRKEIRFERKHKRVLGKRNSNKSLVMECKNILLIEKIFTKEKFLYWKYKEEVRNVLEYFIYIDSYISAVSGYISIHMYVGMHISQGYEEYWEKHILIFFLWKMYLSKDPMTMNLVISSYITSVLHCVKAVLLYLHIDFTIPYHFLTTFTRIVFSIYTTIFRLNNLSTYCSKWKGRVVNVLH